MTTTIVLIMCVAAVLGFALTWLSQKAGVLDLPNARSSHATPTPRAGGLGIVAGFAAGLMVGAFSGLSAPHIALLLITIGLFCALGLIDDLFSVSERWKALVFIGLCVLLVFLTGPVSWMRISAELGFVLPIWAGFAGSVLFAFTVINTVNFMDGSDGMLAAVMVPASIGLAMAGFVVGSSDAALLSFALSGALVGFLFLNAHPAKVFSGDCGSLAVGAAYSAAALMIAGQGAAAALWIGPLFALVFLTDVLLTLLRRARHGRLTLSAHREHAYQRLIQSGWSHTQVAAVYGALTVFIVFSGLVALQGPPLALFLVFAFWTAVLSTLYVSVDRLAAARAEPSGH